MNTNNITLKQEKCISIIEENTKIKFCGTTKQDASAFISKYIKKSKDIEASWEELQDEQYEGDLHWFHYIN